MEVPTDAPNADTPTGIVVARWSIVAMLLAFGAVYLTMVLVGFAASDALWLAGMSSVPLAVAILVGMLVWKFYWNSQ